MNPFAFGSYPLALNLALFTVSAAVVWVAGTRVSRYADRIAQVSGLGHAAVGLVLLAGITSLPEIAVTTTASAGGNASLAVNNLLGSVAMQVAVLAVADFVIRRDALTSVIPDPAVLAQGTLNILTLAVVAAAVIVGDVALAGIGMWSWGLLAFYLVSVRIVTLAPGKKGWVGKGDAGAAASDEASTGALAALSLRALIARTALAALAILAAGFLLAKTGESIARQSGLGQSLGGFVLVAVATSLPEVSTVFEAVRLRRYVMAVSGIFGTNLLNGGLIFLADVVYRGPPVLNEVGPFSAFASLLGIAVTAIFLTGLVERRDRTVLRMGIDSIAVLVVYAGGLLILYRLSPA